MKIYVGIDNGISGACSAIVEGVGVLTRLMPIVEVRGNKYIDDIGLRSWLLSLGKAEDLFVIYEQGQKQPKFGCKTNFAQGDSFATVRTVLSQNGIPNMAVNPRDWQKPMFIGIRGDAKDTKGASIEVCKRLYPSLDLRPSLRAKVPHDGIADATCIATWGKRQNF